MRTAASITVLGVSALSLALSAAGQTRSPLPPGALSIVNEDRFRSRTAICVATGNQTVQRGARKIAPTEVWAGEPGNLRRLGAGLGACDPAWSPDGRRVALIDERGLWVFAANSAEGRLHVEARVPTGELTEFTYRAFSRPAWSSDGALVALVVTNGGTTWVEAFEVKTGRLCYTSPPGISTFSWGSSARELRVGSFEIQLSSTGK